MKLKKKIKFKNQQEMKFFKTMKLIKIIKV